jgi:hypothetical protein
MHIETGHPIQNNTQVLEGVFGVRFAIGFRAMFEVSIGRDGKSIEIRSVDYVKIDSVAYDRLEMSVKPVAANCVNVSLLPL